MQDDFLRGCCGALNEKGPMGSYLHACSAGVETLCGGLGGVGFEVAKAHARQAQSLSVPAAHRSRCEVLSDCHVALLPSMMTMG